MSSFGIFHTIISVVALLLGIVLLVKDRQISIRKGTGQAYVALTTLTSITGLFIFHHGGFGKPHALAIITLATLGLALVAGFTKTFGRVSRHVETVAYSATVLFSLIPAFAETTTRLPKEAPLFESPEHPVLAAINGVLFLGFVAGSYFQIRSLSRARRAPLSSKWVEAAAVGR